MEEIQKTYWGKEVSESLGIGQSTLRKWCMELERNGYNFKKGTLDSRLFTEQDIAALNYFQQLTKAKKNTREQAAKFVVSKFLRIEKEEESGVLMNNIRSIENMLKQVLDQQQKLLERLDSIEKQIKHNGSTNDNK